MAKKYLLSIFIMVFMVLLISGALMLSIVRIEVGTQYEILKNYAQNEVSLLSLIPVKSDSSDTSINKLNQLFEYISKNKQTFTFAVTGDTLIARRSDDKFRFLFSAKNGDLSSSVSSSLDDAFHSDFARALLFADTPSLIGLGFDRQILISYPHNFVFNDENLVLITTMNLEEIIQPYTHIIIITIFVEFILLSIGTIFIVLIYTKSLRRQVRETSTELALSRRQVHELQNIEKSLAEMKKDMEDALDVGLFGFWLYNFETSKSIRSLMHDSIFGYDAIDVNWNFETFIKHVIESDREEVRKSFEKAHKENAEIDIACRITKKNNEERWLWVRGQKRKEDGAIIGIVRDITKRKTMEKEIAKFKEDLEQLVKNRTNELEKEKQKFQEALANIKTLKTLLPICSGCGKIREDDGYWSKVETYIQNHTDTKFSHSMCPECMKKYYSDVQMK